MRLPGFEFATATRIVFGSDTLPQVGGIAAAMGKRALIVTGRNAGRAAPVQAALKEAGLECEFLPTHGEPAVDDVEAGVAFAREAACDVVIGFGGGSAIDCGKAVAAMLAQPGSLMDHLEVVGRGLPLIEAPAPFIAIPTTAGTGAEVTRNAVLSVPEHRVKVSLRSPLMLPRVALIDPKLTVQMPPDVTAATGMDALTQLLEALVSCKASPMTDALCTAAIPKAIRTLPRAFNDGEDLAARENMAFAAMCSGLALANAGLGAVHGFAGPIGGMFESATHGAVCAALLVPVWRANLAAVRVHGSRMSMNRFDLAAQLLTGDSAAPPEQALPVLEELTRRLSIPTLRAFGITEADLPGIATKARAASSMKGNPVPLDDTTLVSVLREAL